MENQLEENAEYIAAKKRVKEVKNFYVHLLVFLLGNAMIIFFKIKGDNHIKISQFLTIILWGSVLLYHGIKVFLPELLFGKRWKERKIRELMEKDRKSNHKNPLL